MSRRNLTGEKTITISADTSSLDRMIDALALDVDEAMPAVAAAGAKVLYDQVKTNVAAMGSVSGNLDKSIYRVLSHENSGPGVATYHISWNHKRAPHGRLVEYGHVQRYVTYQVNGKWVTDKRRPLKAPIQVAARPFIRPAQSAFPRAVNAMEERLGEIFGGGPNDRRV